MEQVVEGDGLVAIGAFKSVSAHIIGEAHLHQVLDFVLESDLFRVVLCPLSSLAVESLKI